jgi:hypothetical protein
MADNSQAGAAVGIGDVFASDDIGGVKWPRAKVTWGVDGSAVDASATNPLPVTGAKTNNGAVPGVDNLGTLPAVANAAAPTRTEGNQVALRTNLAGDVAMTLDGEAVVLGAGAAVIGSLTANQSVNVAQINGVTPLMGNGVTGTGSQRVTIASDNTAFAVNASGVKTNNAGAPGATNLGVLPAVATAANPSFTEGNQVGLSLDLSGRVRTDNSTVAGTVISTGNGTAGAGVQRVAIASDNTAFPVNVRGNAGANFDGPTGSAVPANAILKGCRVATSNPGNAASGNNVAAMADKAGRQVVTMGHIRELIGVQQTASALSTEVTFITAGGASVFNDLASLVITTAGAAAATITIKDATAGTTRMVLNYPNAALAPGAPLVLNFNPPIPQASANNNWTFTNSVATNINVTATFIKNL